MFVGHKHTHTHTHLNKKMHKACLVKPTQQFSLMMKITPTERFLQHHVNIWAFPLCPGSTQADFTNWFPFIQRGELITKISRCVEFRWIENTLTPAWSSVGENAAAVRGRFRFKQLEQTQVFTLKWLEKGISLIQLLYFFAFCFLIYLFNNNKHTLLV